MLTRRSSTSFYYGMRLLDKPKAQAMYSMYAWMRIADDIADHPELSYNQKVTYLANLKRDTLHYVRTTPDWPAMAEKSMIWPAVVATVNQYQIPDSYFEDLLQGMLMDQEKHHYATFGELEEYCYRVASVVGLICLEIWGYRGDKKTKQLAIWQGIAFQLTNIIRDIFVDADMGRLYLPAADFNHTELSAEDFLALDYAEQSAGIEKMIERALYYFRKSETLENYVAPKSRKCLRVMSTTYQFLLAKLIKNKQKLLKQHKYIELGPLTKLWVVLSQKNDKYWSE
jgi:phytoene synthase